MLRTDLGITVHTHSMHVACDQGVNAQQYGHTRTQPIKFDTNQTNQRPRGNFVIQTTK